MRREPVVIVMSVLAGYQVLVAGAAFGEYVGMELAALLILIGAAVQAAVQFYVRGEVTPVINVTEYVNDKGTVIAGPANELVATGATVRRHEEGNPHA